MISDDAVDGLIATSINVGDLTDCAGNATGGLITDIDAGIYAEDWTDCADDAAGGLIASDINAVDYMDCADVFIQENTVHELISVDSRYSADCDDTNVLYDAVYGLMTLMG